MEISQEKTFLRAGVGEVGAGLACWQGEEGAQDVSDATLGLLYMGNIRHHKRAIERKATENQTSVGRSKKSGGTLRGTETISSS